MRRFNKTSLLISLAALLVPIIGTTRAQASEAALLLEEPYGQFGAVNPTGHAAIYLSGVCADDPRHLRLCNPGETGVVISRYHRVAGYDWLAIPLIPYLYAVDDASEVPDTADAALVLRLRDRYRRQSLMDLIPDDPTRDVPGGEWTQLVGSSYDRKIYGYAIETRPSQDDAFISAFNDRANKAHFNLLFRNCANFAESVLNFYYPHSIHRSFVADMGIVTPKRLASSLTHYSKKHRDLEFNTFIIPQVPGTIRRSTPVNGVLESVVKSKKYVVPLALLHPVIAASVVAAYLGDGRFHPDPRAIVFDPQHQPAPGLEEEQQPASPASKSVAAVATSEVSAPEQRIQPIAARSLAADE